MTHTISQDVQHQPMVYLDGGEFSDRTITLGAPSKTYNIPGGCVCVLLMLQLLLLLLLLLLLPSQCV